MKIINLYICRAADTEKDGGLTTSELGEALKKLDLNLSAKVTSRILHFPLKTLNS